MKVHIIGAGGVGGYYCGLLARHRADVSLVCRPEKSAIFRDNGLTILDRGEKFQTSDFEVLEAIEEISEPELVLLSVKTYHLDEVAQKLASVISIDTIVLTLQNGVDSDLRVSKQLEKGLVFPGLTWVLSKMVRPGVIEQKAPRTFIKFGSRDSANHDLVDKVRRLLEIGGVPIEISNDIVSDLWEKFIWLANFAGMAGTRRGDIGSIVNDPQGFELWTRGLDETLAVAKALGVRVDPAMRDVVLQKLEKYKTHNSDFKPSLLVDLENGRPTEIEALSGTLIRLGRDLGVDTPTHEIFYDAICAR